MQSDKRAQHKLRGGRVFTDQHGRKYHAIVENDTGHPVGPLTPQFSAPLIPEQKYFKFKEGDQSEFEIDYHAWIGDLEAAWELHTRHMTDVAMRMSPHNYEALLEKPTGPLIQQVGPTPQLRVEPVMAAQAGNQWVLTGEGEMPAAAAAFFPKKEAYVPAAPRQVSDPFADDKPAPVEAEVETEAEADTEKTYPHWAGPKIGFELADGSTTGPGVSRKDAEELNAALEPVGAS